MGNQIQTRDILFRNIKLRNRVNQWTFDQSKGNWYTVKQNGFSINMSDIGIVESSKNFSISFLLNLKGTYSDWRTLFHFTDIEYDSFRPNFRPHNQGRIPAVWIIPNDTALHIRFATDNDMNDGYNTPSLPLNTPTLITLVFNGDNFKYYVNGNKIVENNYNNIHIRNPNTKLYIGDPWYTNDDNVLIKDFTIYSYSLSGDEINGIKKVETSSLLFSNDCNSLDGWTNNGFAVITTAGQTCFYSTSGGSRYIYINTGLSSLKGTTISFYVYLTGGCPNFYFSCNSSGAGQMLRFEQRFGNGSGFISTYSWTRWNAPSSNYSWPQNTWLPVSIIISSSGVATFSVNNVDSGISYTISDNGGYIGIQADNGGGTISLNKIRITGEKKETPITPKDVVVIEKFANYNETTSLLSSSSLKWLNYINTNKIKEGFGEIPQTNEWYKVRPGGYKTQLSTFAFDNYDNISFSFLLKITTRFGGWRNIFQITNTGGDGGDGRLPAVFIYPDERTNIHMRISTDSGWNDGVDSSNELPLNQPLLVVLIYNGNNFKYYLNGQKMIDQNFNNRHKPNANSTLYISNTWNPADDGIFIKNFKIHNRAINENDIQNLMPSWQAEVKRQAEIDDYNRRANTPCRYTVDQSIVNDAKANKCDANINSCKLGDAYTTGNASVTAKVLDSDAPCKGDATKIQTYSCQKQCPCVYGDLKPSDDPKDKCSATCGDSGTIRGYRDLINGPNSCPPRQWGELYPCNRHKCPPPCLSTGNCPAPESFVSNTKEAFTMNDILNRELPTSTNPVDGVMKYESRLLQAINLFNQEYYSYVSNCNNQDAMYQPTKSNPDNKYCYELLNDIKTDSKSIQDYLKYYNNYIQSNTFQKVSDINANKQHINNVYATNINMRTDLDNKLRELYDIPGSTTLDQNYIFDSTVYYSIVFTIFASVTIYYAFSNLE